MVDGIRNKVSELVLGGGWVDGDLSILVEQRVIVEESVADDLVNILGWSPCDLQLIGRKSSCNQVSWL